MRGAFGRRSKMGKNIGNVDIVREFGVGLDEAHPWKASPHRAKLVIAQWDGWSRNVVRVDVRRRASGLLWVQ